MTGTAADTAAWTSLLGPLELSPGQFLLYLDPDKLDQPSATAGRTELVTDRWSLRRIAEQELRDFRPQQPPLLVHIQIPELRQADDLPFDLRRYPLRVLDVRLPAAALPDVRDLPPRAVEQLVTNRPLPERLAALARALSGLAWPPAPDTAVLAGVRLVQHLGPELRAQLAASCPPGPALRLLCAAEPLDEITALLKEWAAQGAEHPDDAALRAAADDLGALILERQVVAPHTQAVAKLPRVLHDAVQGTQAVPAVLRRLAELPAPGQTLASWLQVADAWGTVRWQLAALPPNADTAVAAAEVWDRWAALDPLWQDWLQTNYAAELSRNVLRLTSVHKVAPFLATSAVEAGAKVLLLVLDGLGVAQWQQIVDHLGVAPVEERRVLACLPTMTTVSRQAIFAGALPTTFPNTVDRTDTEPARWQDFWVRQGLTPEQIHYRRTDGADASAWEDPPTSAVVAGLAVNAIDDLMHGVSVNGDHQFHAAVTTWLGGGFLERALDWAHRRSAQVWVTADHGNLPCLGLGETVPDEGVRVLGRGLRARVYASENQRSQADLPGTKWTPPCFPGSAGAPLFAPDRRYFRRSGNVITHGGLSLDEVVVPFSRIA